MRANSSEEEQIAISVGVIAQLVETRSQRILSKTRLPYAQFVLLLHFCHEPERECTVSSLADAFQTDQSRISKTVRRLLDRGYVAVRPDPDDGRVKRLRVTRKGIQARDRSVALIERSEERRVGKECRSRSSPDH